LSHLQLHENSNIPSSDQEKKTCCGRSGQRGAHPAASQALFFCFVECSCCLRRFSLSALCYPHSNTSFYVLHSSFSFGFSVFLFSSSVCLFFVPHYCIPLNHQRLSASHHLRKQSKGVCTPLCSSLRLSRCAQPGVVFIHKRRSTSGALHLLYKGRRGKERKCFWSAVIAAVVLSRFFFSSFAWF
jgi:hypothetical protein